MTRPVLMPADAATALLDLLEGAGIEVWVDGGWAVDAVLGEQTREHADLDVHAVTFDEHGNVLYGPVELGLAYPVAALMGEGAIVGRRVRCVSPRWLVRFRTGYEPRTVDRLDVAALCARFGIERPEAYRDSARADTVELRAFEPERDGERFSGWLERADVRRWWGDPSTALAELVERAPVTAALVTWDGRPVGVVCWQTPTRAELEEAGLADLPGDLVDVDVLIGEPEARGHGVATEALRQLCQRLRDQGVRLVGLAAVLANRPALRAYGKAGWVPYRDFEETGEAYRYLTRDLSDGDRERR